MKTEILISCDEWENRVAVLEEGSLAEIYFEREEKVIGSIYKGRVENVLPGMGACFVNIGLGRNAFLYVDDILRDPINIGETEITDRRKGHTVNELLKVGGDVLVQIVKEPRGLKGARVSTNISLPGRYLVLMPTGRYSGVSSRIEDENERTRLKQIMRRVRPEGMATIVRTAAQGVSEAELIADLGVQLRLWHGILESYKRTSAPALLHKDLNLVFKAVRDFLTSDVTSVYIDSKEQYDEIRSTMSLLGPQYIDRLKLVDGPGTLFAQRGIDEELQKLLKPKIPLPSGGHLVLEHTEALTVIDVNTGKFTGGKNLEDTIVKTNIEAAAEIARQVRLRDIGGIIVVDFIDMTHERSRDQVILTLTDALRRDRTRSTIQVFSNLGLLEFTRKRVGKDLAGQLRSDCPTCSGLGSVMSSETVAIGVLRQIRSLISRNGGAKKFDVVADPGVATQLLGWYHDEFEKLARDHDLDIALYVDRERHREQVVVEEARRMRPTPVIGSVLEAELLQVRLPNPASGVAEINGYLIEVKDAANATGQTVKLKVDGVEGNMVRAALAEPLPTAGRRRRRDRGRAKDVAGSEAPIAPPVPSLREIEVPDDGRRRTDDVQRRTVRRRPEAVAFSIADDEEEAPRTAAPPAARGGRAVARSGRPSTDGGRGEAARSGRRRSSSGRPGRSATPQPLVVGGEGDIDYDDGDDDAIVTTPSATRAPREQTVERESEAANGAPRRRRRRGRGGKGRGVEDVTAAPGVQDGESAYEEDDAFVPQRPAAPTGRSRAPSPARPSSEEDFDDDLGAVVDPRQSGTRPRQPNRFGPVRQLYGRPVTLDDESRTRHDRPAHDEPRAKREQAPPPHPQSRRPQAQRPQAPRAQAPRAQAPRAQAPRAQAPRPRVEDELDVVIKPKAPAAIHVEFRDDVPTRHRRSVEEGYEHGERSERTERQERPERREPGERPQRVEHRERPDRGERRDRPERGERRDRPEGGERRDRPERGERRERREGESRFGGGRGRQAAPKREGPQVRQLYPPPDHEVEHDEKGSTDGEASPRKPGFGRQPRGPLMRSADAPPVPKGKVRQLYPPPVISDDLPSIAVDTHTFAAADTQAYDSIVFDEPGDATESSVFISDAEELEDRRRRARERAEARRRAESVDDGEPKGESPGGASSRPFDPQSNESDEWPVF